MIITNDSHPNARRWIERLLCQSKAVCSAIIASLGFYQVVALNSPNGASVPLRTYPANCFVHKIAGLCCSKMEFFL